MTLCTTKCPECTMPVHEHETADGLPVAVALLPGNYPARALPPAALWHLAGGLAHRGTTPADYGYAKVDHALVCPVAVTERPDHPGLAELWRALAVRRARTQRSTP